MRKFRDIEELDAWMAPMDYEGFFYALAPYGLTSEAKAHCDQQIALGVEKELILKVMKRLVRMDLEEEYGLTHRPRAPWLSVVK